MPNYVRPDNRGYDVTHKFGRNTDVDTGAAEDIWDGGGQYAFPTAKAATSIVSASANDAAAGTGARTVLVQGLDADGFLISETVTLNGVTPVTLTLEYWRVFRAYVVTAGSGETNAGNIQIKHGATVLAQITASIGQTLMAIYTIPADYKAGWLAEIHVTLGRSSTSKANIALQFKPYGGAWRTLETFSVSDLNDVEIGYTAWLEIPAKSDLRIRCLDLTADNTTIHACFDILLEK